MFKFETQESDNFDELTTLQHGWEYYVSQLGPSKQPSTASLYQSDNVALNKFVFRAAYDQRLRAREGFLSFGLLDADNPLTWEYDQQIPNDSLVVFPRDDFLLGNSPVGFCGSGLHFAEKFISSLAEQVYNQPVKSLVGPWGIYKVGVEKLAVLRAELFMWQALAGYGADIPPPILTRHEEGLALAVINTLIDAGDTEDESLRISVRSVTQALNIIHSSDLETISALELCQHTECSQRTLEKCFSERFGITPKKYIKCLRMAEVRKGLLDFEAQGYKSIIELAGINGFWHMGQFAADYRSIYGELPSETLNRK